MVLVETRGPVRRPPDGPVFATCGLWEGGPYHNFRTINHCVCTACTLSAMCCVMCVDFPMSCLRVVPHSHSINTTPCGFVCVFVVNSHRLLKIQQIKRTFEPFLQTSNKLSHLKMTAYRFCFRTSLALQVLFFETWPFFVTTALAAWFWLRPASTDCLKPRLKAHIE